MSGRLIDPLYRFALFQMQNTQISFFINGLEEDSTAFDPQLLTEQFADAS